jgi:GT2 family glycosyltransferase
MKLSIVILTWNDKKVVVDCLRSIYNQSTSEAWEVIISDNGSSDGSIEMIREIYPQIQVFENGRNLRFAKANNVGIRASTGEYILILNPDTIIHDGSLESMLRFADAHPEAGAFGCKVLNADGSYQTSAQPFPTVRSELLTALRLRFLGSLGDRFASDSYGGWNGETERAVDWITGCFMLVRGELLKQLDGFDEQFFYYYEDTDLCRRIWDSGQKILYTPSASITHLKGQSTSQRLPAITFALDSQITRYLYYSKYFGDRGVRRARRVALVSLMLRYSGYWLLNLIKPTSIRNRRLELLRVLFQWNYRVNVDQLIEHGKEPDLDIAVPARVLER